MIVLNLISCLILIVPYAMLLTDFKLIKFLLSPTVTWFGIRREAKYVEACANSLKEVYCPVRYHIHIGNATSSITSSGCDRLNVYNATKILKRLCNENHRCSPDTSTTSLLYHKRFASIQYMCKGKQYRNLYFLLQIHYYS